MLLLLWSCLADRVYSELQPQALEPRASPEGFGPSAATCAGCHVEIHAEWAASKLGRAWTDPLFQADLEAQGNPLCTRCHAPLAEQAETLVVGLDGLVPLRWDEHPNPDFDTALRDEGVTCVVCHLTEGGAMAGTLEVDAPHPVEVVPEFAAGDVCVRCHQLDAPPLSRAGRPLADTHGEHAEWQELTGQSEGCVSCHMPEVERPLAVGGPVRVSRRHTFDPLIGQGVTLAFEDGQAVLTNLAGHRVPTAEPMRAYVVRATRGEMVEEVRIERLMDRYRDVRDSTLAPGETRRLGFSFPPEKVELVYLTTTHEELEHAAPRPKLVAKVRP